MNTTKDVKTNFSFRADKQLSDRLRYEALRQGMSKNELITAAVQDYLNKQKERVG